MTMTKKSKFDYDKKCFVVKGHRAKGAHRVIQQWYKGDFDERKAKELARSTNPQSALVDVESTKKDDVEDVGRKRGAAVDVELARWAENGTKPTHPLALKAVRVLTKDGYQPHRGKHGVSSRCGSVHTEIDFLLLRDGKVVAIELKTGYPIEFYTKMGKMRNALSTIPNCLFNHACVQVTLGWYLHQADPQRDFEIHDCAVLHLNEFICTLRTVPDWCRGVLMEDLRDRFERRRALERKRKEERRMERERKRLERERKKVVKDIKKPKKMAKKTK